MNYFRERMSEGTGTKEEQIAKLKKALTSEESIVIGAGAGFQHLRDSLTVERDLINISLILQGNTELVICTPAGFDKKMLHTPA